MDVDTVERALRVKEYEGWFSRLNEDLQHVYDLASSFRDGQKCTRACDETGQSFVKGAYNMLFWVAFDDGEKWVVRFPMVGKVCN